MKIFFQDQVFPVRCQRTVEFRELQQGIGADLEQEGQHGQLDTLGLGIVTRQDGIGFTFSDEACFFSSCIGVDDRFAFLNLFADDFFSFQAFLLGFVLSDLDLGFGFAACHLCHTSGFGLFLRQFGVDFSNFGF